MRNRRMRNVTVLLAASSLLAVTACGSDAKKAADTTAAPTTAASTTPPSGSATTTPAAATSVPDTTGGSDTTAAPASTGGTTPSTTAAFGCAATQGAVVGYSEPLPDPNFALIEDVMRSTLEKAGSTLKPVNANLDPTKQIADVNTLLSSGVRVLVINPVDPNAVQGVLGDVRAKNIPVVVQDTKVGGPYFTNVTADVESAAAAGAALLKQKVGDGKVVVVDGPPFAEVLVRESAAFKAAAAQVGLNIVDTQTNTAITPDAARGFAEAWKQKYGKDLAGIWTFNDTSAVGVAAALGGDFTPALVSINGQPEAIPLVKAGTILATYDLQQDMLGRALAFAAIAALCKDTVPADIWVESKLIDSTNVDSWVSPADRGKKDINVKLEERNGKTYLVEG